MKTERLAEATRRFITMWMAPATWVSVFLACVVMVPISWGDDSPYTPIFALLGYIGAAGLYRSLENRADYLALREFQFMAEENQRRILSAFQLSAEDLDPRAEKR